jgi:uncharacterized protein (TIGR03643 family)
MDLPEELTPEIIDRIIEMAWEDRTTFEAIAFQFDLTELMRREMKASSFRMWRKRVTGRKTKHLKEREAIVTRFQSSDQKNRTL